MFLLCCLGSPVESSEGESLDTAVPVSKLAVSVVLQTPLPSFGPVFHLYG